MHEEVDYDDADGDEGQHQQPPLHAAKSTSSRQSEQKMKKKGRGHRDSQIDEDGRGGSYEVIEQTRNEHGVVRCKTLQIK